jgi:hypothetical protein
VSFPDFSLRCNCITSMFSFIFNLLVENHFLCADFFFL